MPTNRNKRKRARNEIDDCKLEDLLYGPGTCLLNGLGYLGPHGDGLWRDKSPEVQAAVLAAMEADWRAASHIVLSAWNARSDHDRYIARTYHGDPAEPWAKSQFGQPEEP